jgi:hypothetical protein
MYKAQTLEVAQRILERWSNIRTLVGNRLMGDQLDVATGSTVETGPPKFSESR